ncbi:FAD:protein FMN transferase [Microbacterium rhizomatis]|uniref:FAD:protein FMN transferase n=1 Tax=Microbacterium rhizomatis TaxID=1631477 RepID=A0A5J5IWW8_9MICO|nr:FAD:protein FMN transferase [Microbacterium rhizomatis]KAA9105642.1 FAD:protein FMN transferase [Microbacterium rhizomatis]
MPATASAPARASWRFEAIGTAWEIESSDPLGPDARSAIQSCIDEFDAEWSRFRADSVVSRLARDAGAVTAPADAADMLDAYAALDDATSGAVNPLVGAALASRGYDAAYSFVDGGALVAPADWRDRLTWAEGTLALDEPATIDVGALGKGRLVDRVTGIVASFIDGDIVVDASGDLAVRGTGVRVGLEHPYDTRRAIGVWEVTDAALCASAVNRRAWGDGLHHVLDARTGAPVRAVAATWAVAPTAMHADAIATALFFDGGEALAAEWGAEWVRMTTDGRVEWSHGSKAELFV